MFCKSVTSERPTAQLREVGVPAPQLHKPEPTQRKTGHGSKGEQRTWPLTVTRFSSPAQGLSSPPHRTRQPGQSLYGVGGRGLLVEASGLGRSKAQCHAYAQPSEGTCPPVGPATAAGVWKQGLSGYIFCRCPSPAHNSSTSSLHPGRLPGDSVLTASGCQGTSCCPRAWHYTCCSWQGRVS